MKTGARWLLTHFFVRCQRRFIFGSFCYPRATAAGVDRRAIKILRSQVWPQTKRLTVDVLVTNESAIAFWRSVSYADYCLTLEILPST